MSQPEKLRWGILGTGMIAKKFAADLPNSATGVLAATASRGEGTAAAFCAKFGGRGLTGYERLLADPEIDAVYNSLPNGLHAEWSIRALEAGKHVLCEKPLARDEAEAAQMFEAAERTGAVLVEAFMYRTLPSIQDLLNFVHSGGIGDLRLMQLNFSFSRPVLASDARYDVRQGGGGMMDVGCYCTNFARALVGAEPTHCHAIAHLHETGVDDYAAGTLRFGDDVLATFTCGMTVPTRNGATIAGTDGWIEIEGFSFGGKMPGGRLGYRICRGDEREERDFAPAAMYASEADAFAGVVRGEEEPWISRDDTLGNMRTLDALRQSAGVPLK